MAKAKKVVLFIVEGFTDKTALGAILTNLLENESVRFAITEGDITTRADVSESNVVSCLNGFIKRELERNAFRYSDLKEIVHLIDTDGAFIPDSAVRENREAKHVEYSEKEVLAPNRDRLIQRNRRKLRLVRLLRGKREIRKKPYRMFYFSRNLEHALHNEIRTLTSAEKMRLAESLEASFIDSPSDFIGFMHSKEFLAPGDYGKSWEFIEEGSRSLERWSNFGIYFDAEPTMDTDS